MQRFEMKAPSEWLERIDQWRGKQPGIPPRAEAIRRLVDQGLRGAYNAGTPSSDCVSVPDAIPEPPLPLAGPAFASEPLAPQLPPLEIPAPMREKIGEYRDTRPWFANDDEAIFDLIKRGLELAEGRDDLVELDEEQVRQLRYLYPQGELGPIISRMVGEAIRMALLSREDDE